MRKKLVALTAMLSLSAVFALTACNENGDPGGSGGTGGTGGGQGDTYQDYNPEKQPGSGDFDFDGNYENPELTIDGLGNDEQWQGVEAFATFGKNGNANVKIYRGTSALFFLFEVKDNVLLTQGVTNDDAVTRGDSIELYLDTLTDGGRTPQSDDYQINLGIHGKTRIMQGAGGQWGSWNGLIDYEVALNGTLNDGEEANDTGYSVEVMIPYAQIMIEKDDTIGIALGQVDKIRVEDAATGSESASWNWYGWSYNGTAINPQVPDQYILLDKDGSLMSRDEQEKAPADVGGYIRDTDGAPVEGVTVTAQSGDVVKTATTNANGYYLLQDLNPELTYSITAEKNGYLTGTSSCTREELRAADGGVVSKDIVLTALAGLETTTLTGTVKNVLNGAVSGATIRVSGMELSAQSGADGTFSLEGVPVLDDDVEIVVSAQGYTDTATVISAEDLISDGTTSLGDVSLDLPASETGAFGVTSLLANNFGYITRTLSGVVIRFEGERTFNGWIELFIDTKTSGSARDNTDVLYQLKADGTVSVVNYGGKFTTDGIVWNVDRIEGGGYTAYLLIPYETLGMDPLERFGISLGQSNGQAAWDGWGRDDMIGTNGIAFVAPEIPTDYVRVGVDNKLYEAAHNNAVVKFGGAVTDANNMPIAGVSVTIGGQTVTTDGSGKWSATAALSQEGLTVEYSKTGYISASTQIGVGDVGMSSVWNETKQLAAHVVTISGTVTDQNTDPVEGVTVTLTYAGGESKTVMTNAQGVYTFSDVTTFVDVTITFAKEGYAQGSETRTAAQLAERDEFTVDKNITATAQIEYITLTGKVVGVSGGLSGAKVEAGDLTATSNQDGVFTIENFPVVDGMIFITLEGYLGSEVSFSASDYAEGGSYAMGEIFLAREYGKIGDAFGTKADAFAEFVPYVTRGEDALMFRFEGSRAFTGHVELYIDTGRSSGEGGRNETDYCFTLRADGSVSVNNYTGSNTSTTTLVYRVENAGSTPVLTFSVPYAFLGIERDEIVGVTFGQGGVQNGDIVSDWDGWSFKGVQGVDGLEFVQPERTWDYIRIDADNQPFWNAENVSLEELDLTGYNLHFGKGTAADSIHAKVSRNASGITFEFVTIGDFGIHDGTNSDYVLIYFDKGEVTGGWDGVDYLVKIDKGGNVYGNAAAWWQVGDNNKLGTIVITRENGVTTFSYTIDYATLGIAADEVVGFTLVEGWRTNADNGSDEYGGFLYTYDGGCYVVADAANVAGYVRIKADGTLVVAASNAAASSNDEVTE